jgi:hypothetical protein
MLNTLYATVLQIHLIHLVRPYALNSFIAGYCNTTSAVNAIRFQMSSGNFDDVNNILIWD